MLTVDDDWVGCCWYGDQLRRTYLMNKIRGFLKKEQCHRKGIAFVDMCVFVCAFVHMHACTKVMYCKNAFHICSGAYMLRL